jgi:hypothetical protein
MVREHRRMRHVISERRIQSIIVALIKMKDTGREEDMLFKVKGTI